MDILHYFCYYFYKLMNMNTAKPNLTDTCLNG